MNPYWQCPACKQPAGIIGCAFHWLFGCPAVRTWTVTDAWSTTVTIDGKTRPATPEEAAAVAETLAGVRRGMDEVSRAMDGLRKIR